MNILVTGVTGRIGANLAAALLAKGYQVRGLVMAGDEILHVLSPQWIADAIEYWVAPGKIPWFGHDIVSESLDAATALRMIDPAAVCGPTGPDGSPWTLHYSDVRDCVAGTLLALEADCALGETFNIVAPQPTSCVEAAQLIAGASGRPFADTPLPFCWSFGNSIEKARRLLGYAPQYSIERMVESAAAFRRGADIGVVPV